MSCFIVPLVQAVATTTYRKFSKGNGPLDRQVPALEKMLWGGTLMLIVDHIVNGELIFRFPFFSALAGGGGWSVMLREMLTVGVPMSAVLTLAWVIYALIKERKTASIANL